MHNNYYFLRQLTRQLGSTLRGAVISECFSQNKEELVIRFETNASPFFIKASLSPQFSCLSFPDNFHRARKNSVDLFQALIGQRVSDCRQFENERSFTINFGNQYSLLFKMHGNRSNLILFEQREVREVFKSSLVEDGRINPDEMDRAIDWSYENFVINHTRPDSIYFTFGKLVWKYLRLKNFDDLSTEQQWQAIQSVREELQHPQSFNIQETDGRVIFSLLDVGKTIRKFKEPITAITEFFNYYTQQDAFTREKAAALSLLNTRFHANENYLVKTQKKLNDLESDNNYKVWADLLMANLHTIPPGSTRITLPDFYGDNHAIEIRLKPDLSPQKNAAIFYKKGKNQQIEIQHLQKLVSNKKEESARLSGLIQRIEGLQDIKSLRKLMETPGTEGKKKQAVALPYREVEFNGYKIWIGKNAGSNDTLTLKFSYKDDLWLHAKDVAGSHVLIKHQAGKNFPKDVIERAAQLAAYYSKRKNESLCPVAVTPKKFVRKRKGDPAGVVVVEREVVVMVEPVSGDR